MSLLSSIVSRIPGLSPQWRSMISEAWQIASHYRNSRSDLMRAIAERNLTLPELQRGLGYLQSGPVASVLNMLSPGLAGQLYTLGSEIAAGQQGRETPQNGAPACQNQQPRRENPFPPLKK